MSHVPSHGTPLNISNDSTIDKRFVERTKPWYEREISKILNIDHNRTWTKQWLVDIYERVKENKGALGRYGRHGAECETKWIEKAEDEDKYKCTCGLDDALKVVADN